MVNLVELLKMTVAELRELARKYVGRGHSRLKTKGELISALKKLVAPQKAPPPKPKKRSPAKPRSKRGPRVRAKRATTAPEPSAHIVAKSRQARPAPKAEVRPPAPLTEGFFAGAQPPALYGQANGGAAQPTAEVGYGTDQVVGLPREPRTLFVFWDLAPSTLRAASDGLVACRLVLRVCAGERVLREHPVELEHGRAYLEDLRLAPGARVELHLVDANNTSRRVAASEIPESFVADQNSPLRLAEIPWQLPLMELAKAAQAGQVRIRQETAGAADAVRSRVAALSGGSSPVTAWGGAPGQRFPLPSSR